MIESGSTDNTIGGTAAGAGNVISGNTGDGVEITGSGTSGNLVAGNLIGTDAAGSAAIGNGRSGVYIGSGATGNTVGGTTATARNVISGGGIFNVYLIDTNDETFQGNYIGTDATGSFALDHSTHIGVGIISSSDNLIGGTSSGRQRHLRRPRERDTGQ